MNTTDKPENVGLKGETRRTIKERRKSISEHEVKEKSLKAANLLLGTKVYKDSRCIMIYMPLGNETDTSCILQNALSEGKKVVVPVSDTVNTDIIPCIITSDTNFSKGAYSINEPEQCVKADEDEIDLVLVPGIAFDKNGGRIGFGKGYYDRFLSKTKAVKVGFCYEFQIVENAYSEKHDVSVDYIVTEKEMYKCL